MGSASEIPRDFSWADYIAMTREQDCKINELYRFMMDQKEKSAEMQEKYETLAGTIQLSYRQLEVLAKTTEQTIRRKTKLPIGYRLPIHHRADGSAYFLLGEFEELLRQNRITFKNTTNEEILAEIQEYKENPAMFKELMIEQKQKVKRWR